MQISPLLFDRQFSRFAKKLRSQSGEGFSSFSEGLPARWEGYKEDLRKEALFRLDVRSWKRKDIGTGRILERAIEAIEINEPKRHVKNNLVDWQNIYGHKNRSHRALLDAKSKRNARYDLEKWFFDFFKTSKSDEEAFEAFRDLAGNRYDIVAYLFYLKDWHQYMPIATNTFDKAFRLLNCDLVTSGHCSWANYSRYNEILLAVQECLREIQGIRDARLIDAHSFCWMLIRLKLPEAPPKTIIPMPILVEDLEEIVIEESEILDATEFNTVDEDQFIKRQAQNRQLGKFAQDIALQSERKRLAKTGESPDVAKPVWNEPKRGYDILSREVDGGPRHIEVKAARRSGKRFSFFLSAYEWKVSRRRQNYYFYLVVNARSAKPTVLMIDAAQVLQKHLTSVTFLSAFGVRV